jgi:hypothetical protein
VGIGALAEEVPAGEDDDREGREGGGGGGAHSMMWAWPKRAETWSGDRPRLSTSLTLQRLQRVGTLQGGVRACDSPALYALKDDGQVA